MSQPIASNGPSPGRRTAIDLRWALVVRIILVALLCVAGAAAFTLRNIATEADAQNEDTAGSVAQHLRTQLFRIETQLDRADRFPDWEAVTNYTLRPGQCVQLLHPNGALRNSVCAGTDQRSLRAPGWFTAGYCALFPEGSTAERALASRGATKGTVRATIAPEAVAERAWHELSRMLGVWTAMVVALCILVYVVVHHALKPAEEILVGINRLGDGDLSHRLPPFRLNELDRISQVLNELALKLQNTTRERADLARQLVDAQERERSHIARELHDDVAQRLAALSVAARSIRKSVGAVTPAVAKECDEFVEMGTGTLRALRETLVLLRPPEIDELGLVTSLQELVDAQNRIAAGAPAISFRRDGDFDGLPAETAAHTYRIVQEALTNALRHAGAKHVHVTLRNVVAPLPGEDRRIELTVADDGEGPGPDWASARPGSVGLIGIRERVFALSGDFHAGPRETGGFELSVGFPASGPHDERKGEAA
ncbi:HAMP domain-containing sensor histidine kinase [Chenggangzhangella methanolivorans]|uniref:HAMP domain-containing protein n=1 Tax=Chenggangzhangella methanolivorans TaxID=1437009 RepID=A0A9E6RCW6_9HYPH|nr:histidine kinase [Chenggangzhangella methanolivorans]QZO01977.1 HAMP domain-containing protein [Chenggangzhangella methanolivorans]